MLVIYFSVIIGGLTFKSTHNCSSEIATELQGKSIIFTMEGPLNEYFKLFMKFMTFDRRESGKSKNYFK
jgi:hypothetical protein